MANKDRVFVAIYTRPDTSTVSCTSSMISATVPPTKYTWGLWIEPKSSSGTGTSFDVEDDTSVPYLLYSFESQFHMTDRKTLPPNMLGRIMVGKVPPGRTNKDVQMILRRVPLPSDPTTSINDTWGWTKKAVEELQQEGVAEKFEVGKFMADALRMAVGWHKSGGQTPEKVNYTWSRTFP